MLVLGFSIPYIDSRYFYLFYANSIGTMFALCVATFVICPDLLTELTDAATISYGKSTLGGVNIDSKRATLSKLMDDKKLYENENLSLSSLADSLEMNSHQLSELINTQYGIGFSRFIREQRVKAAKALLLQEKSASVLSIGLEVGFRSQSNFYAAFKEITGISPGQFRKQAPRE